LINGSVEDLGRVSAMRYITHHFAHLDTLSRARRWLIELGFEPGQIEILMEGIPRIAVRVEPGQVAEVQMVLNACELSDPDGWPSFWDLSRQPHVHPLMVEPVEMSILEQPHPAAIGWHPPDRESSAEVPAMNKLLGDVWTRYR
jgi:hypothetical protein